MIFKNRKFQDWSAFKKAFYAQFLPPDFEQEVKKEWDRLSQLENETVPQYVDKFWGILLKVTLFKKIEDSEKMRKFEAGLHDALQKAMKLYPRNNLFEIASKKASSISESRDLDSFMALGDGLLTAAGRKGVPFSWGVTEVTVFQTLKDKMTTGPVLILPDLQKSFEITERINDVSFRLRLPDTWKIHNAFHVSLLKPFRGDVPDDGELDEQPEVEENEEILVPEQILTHKDTKTKESFNASVCVIKLVIGLVASFVQQARSEASAAFGNDGVYLEKYIQNPRHIEFQVLADKHGNCVHLGERDCSIQRRNQKLLEEAPSPALTAELRQAMGDAAVAAATSISYVGVGTIEFLLSEDGSFYFMEMNTRIQVEHPVTEMISSTDLIEEQIRVALGEKLRFSQADIKFKGHSIECRINAEDAFQGFRPGPGRITGYLPPGGPFVRMDSHIYSDYVVPPSYDSLLGKLIVWAPTRERAISRMLRALNDTIITGLHGSLWGIKAIWAASSQKLLPKSLVVFRIGLLLASRRYESMVCKQIVMELSGG
ncbi:hypothetical protein L7F22_031509 [Adiantum nelumboides]|nr:hypothetical protein [Adiantum nelumboides]